MVRQPGQLERGPEPPSFAEADFLAEEQVDEVAVAHGVGFGPGDEWCRIVGEVGQAEPLRVLPDPVGDQLAHHAAPCFGRAGGRDAKAS